MLLGIDIGTTQVKALILDPATLRPVASAAREVALYTPRPGWAEQHPGDWWAATITTIDAALDRANIRRESIRGIGFSGQMHGTVCVDSSGRAVHPAIIWADMRSIDQVDHLLQVVPTAEMAAHAPGWPAPGYMAMTLMWLRQHKPDLLRNTHRVLLPKDYVRFYLTDQVAADPSDAAATWLFDVQTGAWSERLMTWCGVEGRLLPPLVKSWEAAGALTSKAAELLRLRAGMPVAAGAADCAAQMLGYGAVQPGTLVSILGTGGQVVMPLDAPHRDPAMRSYLYNHAVPDRWYAQAAILAGGLALQWLRDMLGWSKRADAYQRLSALAAEISPGAEGVMFIPHLAGARRMQGGDSASGMFAGLRLHHGPAHLARAVMEGVAFAMRECLDAVQALSGAERALRVIASGGAMVSPVWSQILADVYGLPLHLAEGEHHACIGAAILGGVAAGVFTSVEETIARLPPPSMQITPDSLVAAHYREQYARYRSLAALLEGGSSAGKD